MIKLSVDEAYAFDFLSILELKKQKGSDVDHYLDHIKNEIIAQIGTEKFQSIVNSQEYYDLLDSNNQTFEAVDKAKTDQVSASHVDKCNYQRMISKGILQKKFFSSSLNEKKIGYEKLTKNT